VSWACLAGEGRGELDAGIDVQFAEGAGEVGFAATVDGLIEEIHGRPAAAAEHLRDAASGWETLGYRVEAAFTRADLSRNLRAAGDPAARSAAEHAELLRRELGIVPLLRMGA
jgi:hypothetical protein